MLTVLIINNKIEEHLLFTTLFNFHYYIGEIDNDNIDELRRMNVSLDRIKAKIMGYNNEKLITDIGKPITQIQFVISKYVIADADKKEIDKLSIQLNKKPNSIETITKLCSLYFKNNQFDKAIELYERLLALPLLSENDVVSMLGNILECYKKDASGQKGTPMKILTSFLDKYPNNIEMLYELTKCYREDKNWDKAKKYHEKIKQLVKTKEEYTNHEIVKWKLDYEYLFIAKHFGIKDLRDQFVRLLNYCNNENIINDTLNNAKFYNKLMKQQKVFSFTTTFNKKVDDADFTFYSTSSCLMPITELNKHIIENYNTYLNAQGEEGNPSTDLSKTKYLLNNRFVNYYYNPDGNERLQWKFNIVTYNKFILLDGNFNVIYEKMFDTIINDKRCVGIEDLRVYYDKYINKLIFIGNTYNSFSYNRISMSNGEYDLTADTLEYTNIKPTFANNDCEKNWCYVDYKNETHIIYGFYPLQICKLNRATNQLDKVEEKHMPNIFRRMRGSTPGFSYNNEIWFNSHLVSYETPRHYYHVICVFDKDLNLLRYTAPIKFTDTCIEYSLSIVVEDDRVLITYSTWDRTTNIGIYDKSYIESLLCYN